MVGVPFELPEDSFTAGTYRTFILNVFDNGIQIDVSKYDVWFSLSDYVNDGEPIISKMVTTNKVTQASMAPVIKTALLPEETKNLRGKYIYQFMIRDQEIPVYCARGLVTIYRNIDPDLIT